jgi:signal transduction histidine kinase
MAIARDDSPPESGRSRFGWAAENPIVEAMARVPLPIRAKQLFGSVVVAVLLASVAVVGLTALGQSNSRGKQLRQLQVRAAYAQLILTAATQLKTAIDYRINASTSHNFGSGLDQTITNSLNQLCSDAGLAGCSGSGELTPLPFKLVNADPSLFELLASHISLFDPIVGYLQVRDRAVGPILRRADRFAASLTAKAAAFARRIRTRANTLVAADQSSYSNSRSLLIGVGAGSLLLALALGLLLSDSILVPLRKTQRRLAAIAAGDFSGHLDVSNRDEIGVLAADVNRMSDELRRLYSELEAASRHKSDFLATMSHELRTPLNAIIGFSEVLKEQMFGELNERQLAYVNDVLEAGRHLLSLINDVLDLAKIEAGKLELELTQVEIPRLLESAVSINSERANRGSIKLALTTEREDITVTADERRVRQVVFNLLSNALKFTPANGQVDLFARLHNSQVEIAVTDTGPGIPPEELETIFEEYEQTETGKQAEGTGLGLPLSRKLVELHGGRLWAESRPGHGSTFRFTLPVQHTA